MMLWRLLYLVGWLYLAAYRPARLAFLRTGERPSIGDVILFTTLGWGAQALLAVLCMRFGIPAEVAPVVFAVAGIATFFLPGGGQAPVVFPRPHWALVLLAILAMLPPLAAGLREAFGRFPVDFIEHDVAYYLVQSRQLATTDVYPPPSLGYDGFSYMYHYGTQMMVALAVRLTGLTVHFVQGAVFFPVVHGAIVVLLWRLSTSLTSNPGLAACGFILLQLHYWRPEFPPGSLFRPEVWQEAELTTLTMQSNLYSELGALMVLTALLTSSSLHRGRLLWYVLATMPVFKQPALVPLGLGVAWWRFYEALSTRQWRAMLLPVSAGMVAIAFYLVLSRNSTFQWRLAGDMPSWLTLNAILREVWVHQLALGALVLTAVTARRVDPGQSPRMLGFMLLPYVFINVFGMSSQGVSYGNFFQAIFLVPLLVAASVWTCVAATFARANRRSIAWFTVMFVGWAAPFLLNRIWTAYSAVAAPELSPEYVDNRAIAEALATIPLEGSVIVSNDLRYPAKGYARVLLQIQIPAIFGHQCFNCTTSYEAIAPDSAERIKWQEQLGHTSWNPDLLTVARRYGWTHYLVHLDYQHPSKIPLALLFESSRYRVYAWPR